jgi:hypothetical protein
MSKEQWLLAIVVLNSTGAVDCGSNSQNVEPDAGSVNYTIAPEALAGCRAPDEPGCATCCTNECCISPCGSVCDARVLGNGDPAYTDSAYTECTTDPLVCPSDCQPCARCSKKSESLLRKGLECDCARVVLAKGDLACSDPTSCACYCAYLEAYEAACPAAK